MPKIEKEKKKLWEPRYNGYGQRGWEEKNSHVRFHEKGMGNASMVKAQHDVTVNPIRCGASSEVCFLKACRKR